MGCSKSHPEPIPLPLPVANTIKISQKSYNKSKFVTTKLAAITEKYKVLRAIGSGTIGTLFHAMELSTESIRTIREVNKSAFMHGVEVFQEVNILRDLDHPNILKIFEAIETPRSYYIVLENISGGTLADRFKKIALEGVLSKYVHEMFAALNYLHKKGIIHCNLAPEYIVLSSHNEEAVLKVIGFTSAQILSQKKEIDLRNLKYPSASPEVIAGSFSEKSDVWSAGVILYALLTERLPFPKGSRSLLIQAITAGNIDFSNSVFLSLSQNAQDLIKSCLSLDPYLRPSCEEVLNHPWFHESKQTLPITYNIAQKIMRFSIKNKTARTMLTLITYKLSSSKKDYTIINYFKSLDLNNDGKVSKEEILNVFNQVGLNVASEIDFIMDNLDSDKSGFIDYTELILALTNWQQELKKKNLSKVFAVKSGYVTLKDLEAQLPDISLEEWAVFETLVQAESGRLSLVELKKYLKSQVSF